MTYYDHDKDYFIAAFITNLGKYNEGEHVGEWVTFPTTAEKLKEVFKRIGIGQKDGFGHPYEEWFITDYDCYEIYPDITDYDDLERYYIEELGAIQVPAHLQNYIDYEAYGRDVALEENGTFTGQGYVRDTREIFYECYDGELSSIPDEYRVMTFQADLSEEEKSDWAMDIAFDVDEFFRQNDPQYAAEHPEEHAAKEEIYEKLMAGHIYAIDKKLATIGQTKEDYLPSEIEKFKDATGCEEFLILTRRGQDCFQVMGMSRE